jgi:hypothetical protein
VLSQKPGIDFISSISDQILMVLNRDSSSNLDDGISYFEDSDAEGVCLEDQDEDISSEIRHQLQERVPDAPSLLKNITKTSPNVSFLFST